MKRWLVIDGDGKALTVWGYLEHARRSAASIKNAKVIEEWSGLRA